eukprot:COSAG02_NODE_818_length_16813_cov_137.642874_15_plen_123_part_00
MLYVRANARCSRQDGMVKKKKRAPVVIGLEIEAAEDESRLVRPPSPRQKQSQIKRQIASQLSAAPLRRQSRPQLRLGPPQLAQWTRRKPHLGHLMPQHHTRKAGPRCEPNDTAILCLGICWC